VLFTEVGHGEPDNRVDLDLGEVREVTFDARIHDLVAVVVEGETYALAQTDLVPAVVQAEGLGQDALPGKLLQVLGLSLGEYPRIRVCSRCQSALSRQRQWWA